MVKMSFIVTEKIIQYSDWAPVLKLKLEELQNPCDQIEQVHEMLAFWGHERFPPDSRNMFARAKYEHCHSVPFAPAEMT